MNNFKAIRRLIRDNESTASILSKLNEIEVDFYNLRKHNLQHYAENRMNSILREHAEKELVKTYKIDGDSDDDYSNFDEDEIDE
jgi:hypothetical protein